MADGRTVLFPISQDKLYRETNNDQTKSVFIAHTDDDDEEEAQKVWGELNSNRLKNPHTRTHTLTSHILRANDKIRL